MKNIAPDPSQPMQHLLSVRAAAQHLGISRSKFYEHLRAGRIAAFKDGGRTLIPRDALDGFLSNLRPAAFRPLPVKQAGRPR